MSLEIGFVQNVFSKLNSIFRIGRTRSTEEFTSSGTFNVPSNVRLINFILVAGGGGGGSGEDADVTRRGAGGGGGGMGCVAFNYPVTGGDAITVTIGSAGTAGTSSGNGGDGGDSVFDSITVAGGHGGIGGAAPPQLGGKGGNENDITDAQIGWGLTRGVAFIAGGNGGRGGDFTNSLECKDGQTPFSSHTTGVGGQTPEQTTRADAGGGGGASIIGNGGTGGLDDAVGGAATGYGGGGGGSGTSSLEKAGGAGTAGYCLVEYWS
jgi:hypothetical protein